MRNLWWLLLIAMVFVSGGTIRSAVSSVPVEFARYPAISPDGETIAFSWHGDIWVVASGGGTAQRLTSHPAYDSHPVWSHSGDWIAFASKRHGNSDVFLVKSTGGVPKRLTYHSMYDQPLFWLPQDQGLIFHSNRHMDHSNRHLLYRIAPTGGTPQPYIPIHAAGAALSPDGRYLVLVRGAVQWWRKRWNGPYHRHLWLYDTLTKTYTQLTASGYTADYPSWISANEIVFRSEQTGTFNVWKMNVETKKAIPLTHYRTQGVRHVHGCMEGKRVVFTRWTGMYGIHLETSLVQEIKIQASGDKTYNPEERKVVMGGISEYAVSPNQQEIAFVVRGDIFVKRVKDPDPWSQRIASSSWREKQLNWSPDGTKLAFVSDREGGRDSIFVVHGGKKHGVPLLLSQTLLPRVIRLTSPTISEPEQHPLWSPQGKELAFLRGRGMLVVRNDTDGKERVVVSGWNVGSFQWSPDGQWILFSRVDDESNEDIFLVPASGRGEPLNVSRFPDEDMNPVWSANGRVIAFLSRGVNNRYGIRYAFLQRRDHEKTEVELKRSCIKWAKGWKKRMLLKKKVEQKKREELLRAALGKKRGKEQGLLKKKVSMVPASRPTSRPVLPVRPVHVAKTLRKRLFGGKRLGKQLRVDVEDLAFRLRYLSGLPGGQGPTGLAISSEGCRFYIEVQDKNSAGIYEVDLFGKSRRLFEGRVAHVSVSRAGAVLFLGKGGVLQMLGVGNKQQGKAKAMLMKAELKIEREIEKMQIFTEGWSWLNQWFYDPQFHGVNWTAVRQKYTKLLSYAHTREDFDDVVQMMLGELNASHLGIYAPRGKDADTTGDLGVRFDPTYTGVGLKIASVRWKGPGTHRKSRLYPGDILLSIDGNEVSATKNPHRYLNHVGHRDVVLQVRRRDGKEEQIALRTVPVMVARTQRYEAWVKQTRQRVKQWSGGLLGYAHIRSMGLPSLDTFERDLFAHVYGKHGLVLDLRFNGGGWTADYLLAMFFPKPHSFTRFRGSGTGYPVFRRPFYSWHKPIVLLINEKSISNAEIFAHAFKNLKRGKIVGTPTYGGVISTRNIRLLDGSIFRIPLRGWWTLPGKVNMENNPAVPDVLVVHTPADEETNQDHQLMKAVRLLLEDFAGKK